LKKKQKTFVFLAPPLGATAANATHLPIGTITDKCFLVLFFKKEHLSYASFARRRYLARDSMIASCHSVARRTAGWIA
jgi:hypothetical protein